MDLSLKNNTALICGSTQGIGLAIARELALLGANCILLARNEDRLKEVVASLDSSLGQTHQFAVADFQHTDQVKETAAALAAAGTIHILVNNTGGPAPGLIQNASADQFLNAFQQHIINNQQLVQALLPGMKAARYGRIINVISTSVKMPIPNLGVSNTIRAATAGWWGADTATGQHASGARGAISAAADEAAAQERPPSMPLRQPRRGGDRLAPRPATRQLAGKAFGHGRLGS